MHTTVMSLLPSCGRLYAVSPLTTMHVREYSSTDPGYVVPFLTFSPNMLLPRTQGSWIKATALSSKRRFTSVYYRHALATLELLMVKHGMLDVSGCHFSSCDIDAVLDCVCTA